MANNFQLTGTNYISKAGVPGGSGTKDAPKKGANEILLTAATNIIGTGGYTETIGNITTGGTVVRNIKADGKVMILGNGTNAYANISNSQGYLILEDIEFSGFANVIQVPASTIAGSGDGANFIRCILRDISAFDVRILVASGNTRDTVLLDSVLINVNGVVRRNNHTTSPNNYVINRSIIKNCNLQLRQVFDLTIGALIANSYVAPDATLDFKDKWPVNCNYRGKIILSDVTYNSIEAAHAARPELGLMTTLGNINQDPGFISEEVEMFTLKKTSPHLAKAIGPAHLRLGAGFFIKGPEGDVTADSGHYLENISSAEQFPIYFAENLVASVQGTQLRLKVKESIGGPLTGRFKVARRVSQVPVALGRNDLAIGLNFNSDYPATEGQFDPYNPQVLNNNVPNALNYTSGDAGRKPNRLDYLRRWSNKDNPNRNTSADWVTGSNYLAFATFSETTYNPATLKGNADPAYQVAPTDTNDTPTAVVATWVDDEIWLSNGYYSK